VAVSVTVTATTGAAVERAFDAIAPIDLSRIFTGFGPLPAVRGVRGQAGAWDHLGATRVVELSDGSEAREAITAYERPRHFAYRVGPFTGPFRRLVRAADGAWWFAPATASGGTEIHWTYAFEPARFAAPAVRLAVAPLWRAYARRVLARAVSVAEAPR
jgi:Polyketide cyclase / dehydrase and lipid transport